MSLRDESMIKGSCLLPVLPCPLAARQRGLTIRDLAAGRQRLEVARGLDRRDACAAATAAAAAAASAIGRHGEGCKAP